MKYISYDVLIVLFYPWFIFYKEKEECAKSPNQPHCYQAFMDSLACSTEEVVINDLIYPKDQYYRVRMTTQKIHRRFSVDFLSLLKNFNMYLNFFLILVLKQQV